MPFNLKISEETIKAPLIGTEMIRLATTGANWRTTTADLFLAALPQPLVLGGHAVSSKLTLRSTDVASGATTDAIDLVVGNSASLFHGLYVQHVAKSLTPTQQTLMVNIGADGSYSPSTPAKLNVVGGGHYDVGGATILCETADLAHCSVQFTSLAPNVWPDGTPVVGSTNYKTYNYGINGPDWGSLSGAAFVFDHDYFVHRTLWFPDGSMNIGNDAAENPAILTWASTAPDHPLVLCPGVLVGVEGVGVGTDEIGCTLVAGSSGFWAMTLPTGPGSNGQKLTTNGSGVCSWT